MLPLCQIANYVVVTSELQTAECVASKGSSKNTFLEC